MPVPRVNMPKYKKTEKSKMMDIVVQLYRMDYNVDNARDAIQIIEVFKLDKSQFNFPYGSFEEAKKHVLFGEFDFDENAMMMTNEEREQLRKDVEKGRTWITY